MKNIIYRYKREHLETNKNAEEWPSLPPTVCAQLHDRMSIDDPIVPGCIRSPADTLIQELSELVGPDIDFDGLMAAITCANSTNDNATCPINTLSDESIEADLEINAAEASVEMEVAMDSGATANVAHPKDMPSNIVIRPNDTDFHFERRTTAGSKSSATAAQS